MINPDIDLVIFDCDGTLVDSEPITVGVLVEFVAEYGLKLEHKEALEMFVGRDMAAIVKYLEAQIGRELPEVFSAEFRDRQATALRRDLVAIDGAHDLLAAMKKPFCLASNAPQDKIAISLLTTHLDAFFTKDRTFSAYDINVWKPLPDLFLYAAKKMNVAPERCVVIEDSSAGINAGIAAGMQVIGYSTSSDKQPSHAVPFVHRLTELIDILA